MAKGSAGFDWITIILYFLLVIFGWLNIYSASLGSSETNFLDMTQPYGKQAFFIGASVLLIIIVLSIEAKFYQRFSSVIYLVSLLSLVGLFIFGKTISGATSWYAFGSFSLQPSEFAKFATALALAKYLSDLQTNIRKLSHQVRAFIIIAIPAILIVPQPDPGSALVYAAFFFPLYREGLSGFYLVSGLSAIAAFIFTLVVGPIWVTAGVLLIATIIALQKRKK